MIMFADWTTVKRETSCKKFLVTYNADPLFVESKAQC